MVKKDLQLLHKNHLIEEFDFKALVNYFAQIDMLKLQIKRISENYKDVLKELKENDKEQVNE